MARIPKNQLQTYVNYGLLLVGLAIIIAVLAGWFAASHTVTTQDKSKLQQTASNLTSYAAESRLVAEQYQHQRSTKAFTKVAATKLHTAVSSLADQIEQQPVTPDAEQQAEDLTNQASDLEEALSDLIRLPDPKQATQISQKIQHVQREVEDMQ